jgi:ParB/RepB/Spo0J family partition protein
MAKMQSGAGLREIPLSQIVNTGNVRADYRDIEELAESIKRNGQLEPVLVKTLEKDADGIEQYELIAGHRRYLAHRFLHDQGESITNIKALIVTGDKLTLQLIENLQRSDLTAAERESGIYAMCKNGLSQKEVAARLSKPDSFVSRNVSAYKIREAAAAAGIDASGLATGTLNEIQAAAAADYPGLVKEILQNGGTLEAARTIMEIYRIEHGKPANPRKPQAQKLAASPSPGLHPSPVIDPLTEQFGGGAGAVDIDIDRPPEKPAPKTENKKDTAPRLRDPWKDDFDPPHKQVDFNSMCLTIMEYGKNLEKELVSCKKYNWQSETDEGCCAERCGNWYKHEAVKDIIALLHTRL